MKLISEEKKYSWILLFFIVLSFVEGLLFFIMTLSIPSDPKNTFILNFSISRIILLLMFLAGFGILGYILLKINKVNKFLANFVNHELRYQFLFAFSIYTAILLVITLFVPSGDFGKSEAFYLRIRPLCLWIELMIVQASIYVTIFKNQFNLGFIKGRLSKKLIFLFFIPLIIFWAFIAITKIGLVHNIRYWFEPGVPLSSFQFFGVLLLVILLLIIKRNTKSSIKGNKLISFALLFVIYLSTFLIWDSSEMSERSYLSLKPTSPNYQPFPDSDAREHDLGAISILKGEGIYFKGFTDKPFYMVILSVLHLFSNNDYNLLTSLHVLFLSMISPLLFYFGNRFIGKIFGLFISLLIIFQLENAILFSNKILTTNVKQFGTEGTTLLFIILIVYTLFIWMRTFDERKVLILGGLIGVLSLIRINSIFLIPLCILICIFQFYKNRRLLIKQIALFLLSFVMVFSPWLITGTNSEGIPWLFIKLQDVVNQRYGLTSGSLFDDFSKSSSNSGNLENIFQINNTFTVLDHGIEEIHLKKNDYKIVTNIHFQGEDSIQKSIFNHFLHNISTSFLSLPDFISINIDNVIKTRGYWARNNNWEGEFSPAQYIFFVANLFFLSIGLAESWRRYQWAGIAPILVFLTYCLSLSFALHSGSRSIVPINWIVFFYFTIGLYTLINGIMNYSGKVDPKPEMDETYSKPIMARSDYRLAPTIRIFLIIGMIIPVLNNVVPRIIKPATDSDKLLANIIHSGLPTDQFLYGDIVYPYNDQINKKFTFDLLSKNEVKDIEVTREFPVNNVLHFKVERKYLTDKNKLLQSIFPALIVFGEIQGKYQPTSIYRINNDSNELIWNYQE